MTEANKWALGAGAGLLAAAAAWGCAADTESHTGATEQAISPHDRYILTFSDELGAASAHQYGEVLVDLGPQNAVAAEIPENAIEELSNQPGIESIEVDPVRYPQGQEQPYGIEMVQADLVSDAEAGNKTVCVIDSGYDIAHEDLPDGEHVTKSDLGDTGDAFEDGCGHGTHVTGTIAALNNDVGVVGVLPSGLINIHVVKYFNDSCGASFASDLVDAANECVDAGADVINMSLGGSLPSGAARRAFAEMLDDGILPVAAAGNDGNNRKSYPASYDAVISVAAIDDSKEKAEFSQTNNQVELAAPGVGVLSTVPVDSAEIAELTSGGDDVSAAGMDGSPLSSGTGPLVDCGLGTDTCEDAEGAVCLIERGEVSFADKVLSCQAGGGAAAVIYNNEDGDLFGTLGDEETSIPSAGIRQDDGQALLAHRLGEETTLEVEPGHYDRLNGTSMASPHVAGVAALVWSHHPDSSAEEIRAALQESAKDLGEPGRNHEFGFGLVQAQAALEFLGGGDGVAE